MNRKLFIIALLMFYSVTQLLFPQNVTIQNINLSHPIKFGVENQYLNSKNYSSVPDTFKIIAILVQFQEDSDPLSTGNGKFDLSNKYYNPSTQRDTINDAPPYDSVYFANHLLFLKNYYKKCSNNKVIINFEVYGRVINLPKQMKMYSPQKNENNNKLGELFTASWQIADSFINFSNIDTNKTAFVIFHSGVGRDVDLTSIYGYDPAPFDIPSVYLGLKNLKEIYGTNYNGYITNEGKTIKNSLIIPSTEIRELNLISGNYLLELGINGLLSASFGSFLGLPDLFNTQTGKTAIGRFGLMDGQSIFSYNGIFPPEPSAWEKIFLGWVEPNVLYSGNYNLNIKSSSSRQYNDSTIFKIFLNSKEYFLIENRQRNPDNTGQKVYIKNRQFIDSSTYLKDIVGFINYDVSKIDGIVYNVKTFDWSLPGQIDDTSNYKGGILIWHIDENIIDANFSTNSINNNINHKGVDLEEAKGSQDIGVTINTPFGEVTGDGYFVDFWYKGNHFVPSNIYQNEFTPTSYPNSLSYSLANNNIFIYDFDTIATEMKFKVKIGSDVVKPINGFPKYIGLPSSFNNESLNFDINNDNNEEIFANNGIHLFAFKSNGQLLDTTKNGVFLYDGGYFPPTILYLPALNSQRLITYFKPNTDSVKLGFYKFIGNNLTDSSFSYIKADSLTSVPLIYDSLKIIIPVKTNNKYGYYEKRFDNFSSLFSDTLDTRINQFAKINQQSFIFSTGSDFCTIGNLLSKNSIDTLRILNNNSIRINNSIISTNIPLTSIENQPVLADLNKDGMQEIILINDKKLYAFNSNGVILENFPFQSNKDIKSGISVADLDNDGIFELIFATTDGDLFAYNIKGKIINGFPIKTGINTISTPSIANFNDTIGLTIYGGDGYLYAYKTNFRYISENILWKNFQKDRYFSNSNFQIFNSSNTFSEKLPASKLYNWPNPIYDNITYIRYYPNGNCTSVKIKILDLAGELVTTLTGTTFSKTENEIKWNAADVQSGIYYGVIEAEIDGNKETGIIKIAVVK